MIKPVRFLSALNTKAVLALSILLVCYVSYLTNRIGSDQLEQLGTVTSFLNGKGYVYEEVNAAGEIVTHKLNSWPYGYRVIATPFMALTSRNAEATYLLVLFLSQALLLFSVYKILSLLPSEHTRPVTNFALIFLSVSTAPMRSFADIDCFTAGVYFISIYYLLLYFKNGTRLTHFVLFTLLLSVLPLLRYAYIVQSVSLLFFFVIADYAHNRLSNKMKYLLWALPVVALVYTLGTEYFGKTSARLLSSEIISNSEKSVIPLYYAPFFNSLFPDYIIVSFLKKVPAFYAKAIVPLLALFALFSMAVFIYLAAKFIRDLFLKTTISDKLSDPKLLLAFSLLVNLLFIVLLYNSKTFTKEEINSGAVIYGSMAVVNRYLAVFHISTLLLIIFYTLSGTEVFSKAVLLTAFCFGALHFAYLRVSLSPVSRQQNMNVMNQPVGSYNDLLQLYNKLKHEERLCFVANVQQDSIYNRQLLPKYFATVAGAVVGYGTEQIDNFLAEKQFSSIVVQEENNYSKEKYSRYSYVTFFESNNYCFLKIKGYKNAQQ